MTNFYYHIPTDIYFGKGQISALGERLPTLGRHILLVYGGGSIKRSGLYERVCAELHRADLEWEELAGVEPNPRIQTVRRGAAICCEKKIDVVLAVGGGSTIDCAKMVAAAACYDGDAWDLVLDGSKVEKTLPVVSVLTLAATGSEMDGFSVISNYEKNEKWVSSSELYKPRFSIMDPEYTFSVPAYQTACGASDIISHTLENYFNTERGAYLQARMAEGILKTCIHYAPIAIAEPDNYEARANLMWASSMAINGVVRYGEMTAWSVHPMEHELSAFYDITHGAGLALLTPYWMEQVLGDETIWRFVEYGVNVWGISSEKKPYAIAQEAIAKTREFFVSLGMPSHLSELEIDDTKFDIMAEKAAHVINGRGFAPMSAEIIRNIYTRAL